MPLTHDVGKTVVLQEVWGDRVWAARPMTVVRDDDELVALWFPEGTRWKAPTTPPTRPAGANRGERLAACALRGDWVVRDAEWDVTTISLMREGDWHAIWVSWRPDGTHWGWYVNLQKPFRRTELGFETMDLMLDLIVDPDGSWRWKDEDELATFVTCGIFDTRTADRVREEGARVAARVERNEPPFSEPWAEWRPNPAWKRPELPTGWDCVCR